MADKYVKLDDIIETLEHEWGYEGMREDLYNLPTADVVKVSKVAEMLDDAFGNDCPCNFKNIDEWLPYVCEYGNTCDCSSVKCWEQLIKHYGERRCEK